MTALERDPTRVGRAPWPRESTEGMRHPGRCTVCGHGSDGAHRHGSRPGVPRGGCPSMATYPGRDGRGITSSQQRHCNCWYAGGDCCGC